MSELAPITELPLFAPPAPERVKLSDVHAAAEREHAAFFERLRDLVGKLFAGREITSDQVRWTMDRYVIDFPPGASPNVMGTFFSGWDRAVPVMVNDQVQLTRPSQRKASHGNPLKVWRIT